MENPGMNEDDSLWIRPYLLTGSGTGVSFAMIWRVSLTFSDSGHGSIGIEIPKQKIWFKLMIERKIRRKT